MHRDFAVAVKAVIVRGDEVLVLRRSKGEMAGSYMNKYQKWDLPGGGLHFYEKAEDGLLREKRPKRQCCGRFGKKHPCLWKLADLFPCLTSSGIRFTSVFLHMRLFGQGEKCS